MQFHSLVKYLKIVSIALLPLFVVVLLEAVITFILLSFVNFSAPKTAIVANVGRILVAIYLLYFYSKKPGGSAGSVKNNSFLVSLVLGSIAISFIENAVVHLVTGNNSQFLVTGNYNWSKIITGLFIASWTEEVLFRGWLLNYLRRNVSMVVALLVSSFLFGFWHYNVANIDTWPLIVLHFFTGLFLGIIFVYTQNILYSILAHFFMNLTIYSSFILELPANYLSPILIVSMIYFSFFSFRLIQKFASRSG